MKENLIKGVIISMLLICGTFSTITLPLVFSEKDLVAVTTTTHGSVTVVEYQNSEENIFDVKSVVLEVDKGGKFKSFKTEKGWIGKKTSDDTITFTSTIPIKPGQSAKFGIKTDKSSPVFKWKAFDAEGDEIGSGGTSGQEPETEKPQKEITPDGKPEKPPGVLDDSTFKLIPPEPKVGSSLRIVGDGFGSSEKLDFYINNDKIDSFVTDENGAFILSTKVPDNTRADRSDFIIKDQLGNKKSISIRIGEASSRTETENIKLAAETDPLVYRGDEKIINGIANPGSTLTVSISDSTNKTLTTFIEKVDNTGKYTIKYRIPVDSTFGKYIVTITDGKTAIPLAYTVESSQKISLVPLKLQYEPGETATINGTAIPNQELQIAIHDPVDMEVYSKSILVGDDGTVTFDYKLDSAAREGTYVVFATQGGEHETSLFGVGEEVKAQLIARMSATNYKTVDKAVIYITGLPDSTINLVVIDPSDKPKFSDSIKMGADGYYEYSFELNEYTPGIYTAVLSRGNSQAEERFSVGLQTGSGAIKFETVKKTYAPGESILLLGKSDANSILTIALTDPNGSKIKSEDVFTDKKGIFTSSSFRFPIDAQPGVWKLEVTSGVNHVSKDLVVYEQTSEGLTVRVDKTPPTYTSKDIVIISGNGAGKSHTVVIEISNPDKTLIQKLSIIATGAGSYSTILAIPENSDAGTYLIQVSDGKNEAETTFTVQ